MSVCSKPMRQVEKGSNHLSGKKPPQASPPSEQDDSNMDCGDEYDFETVSDKDEDNDDQGHSSPNAASRRE